MELKTFDVNGTQVFITMPDFSTRWSNIRQNTLIVKTNIYLPE